MPRSPKYFSVVLFTAYHQNQVMIFSFADLEKVMHAFISSDYCYTLYSSVSRHLRLMTFVFLKSCLLSCFFLPEMVTYG